jgi:hypothetical protein
MAFYPFISFFVFFVKIAKIDKAKIKGIRIICETVANKLEINSDVI